jgi:hypothetical protein
LIRTLLKKLLRGLKKTIEFLARIYIQAKLNELKKLPFFHSLHFGIGVHECSDWKTSDRKLHSDADFALVVTRGGKVSGLVGFEVTVERTWPPVSVIVKQLQGAPRANFHDGTITAGEYFLDCAKKFTNALGVRHLYVITPETAVEFRTASREYAEQDEVTRAKIDTGIKKMFAQACKDLHLRWSMRLRRHAHYVTLT